MKRRKRINDRKVPTRGEYINAGESIDRAIRSLSARGIAIDAIAVRREIARLDSIGAIVRSNAL